jgi:hypothetical protein
MIKESGFTYTPSDPVLYEIVIAKPELFTPKQVEILGHILQGRSNKEIASLMGIATGTVKNQICSSGLAGRDAIFSVSLKVSGDGTGAKRSSMIWNFLHTGVLELKPVEKESQI